MAMVPPKPPKSKILVQLYAHQIKALDELISTALAGFQLRDEYPDKTQLLRIQKELRDKVHEGLSANYREEGS